MQPKVLASDHVRPELHVPNFNLGVDALFVVAITCQGQEAASAHNLDSIPLVVESAGGWCKAATHCYKRLAWREKFL